MINRGLREAGTLAYLPLGTPLFSPIIHNLRRNNSYLEIIQKFYLFINFLNFDGQDHFKQN